MKGLPVYLDQENTKTEVEIKIFNNFTFDVFILFMKKISKYRLL